MARKVSLSGDFLSPFIAEDDGAVGPNADYEKYVETGRQEHLDLVDGEKPDLFWVKRLTSREMVELNDLIAIVQDDEKDDLTRFGAADKLYFNTVKTCLRGADHYEYAVERDESGEVKFESFSIERGSVPTDEQAEIIVAADTALAASIFKFAVSISSLSEKEKN